MTKGYIILLSILFLGCNSKLETIEHKFDNLKNLDYGVFLNTNIVNRKGVYFVTYKEQQLAVKSNFWGEITTIEKAYSKDKAIELTKNDIDKIKRALESFKTMNILSLKVDAKQNVFISVPHSDSCTYYFLKLSPYSTLENIKKQYYEQYVENWYLYKECAKRK